MEVSPAHTPATKGELDLASGNYYYKEVEEDISLSLPLPFVPSSSKSPVSLKIPPSLPIPLSFLKTDSFLAPPLVFPFSPLAPLLLTPLCCMDLPQVRSPGDPLCPTVVSWSHWLFRFTWVSTSISYISVCRPSESPPWLLPPSTLPWNFVLAVGGLAFR